MTLPRAISYLISTTNPHLKMKKQISAVSVAFLLLAGTLLITLLLISGIRTGQDSMEYKEEQMAMTTALSLRSVIQIL